MLLILRNEDDNHHESSGLEAADSIELMLVVYYMSSLVQCRVYKTCKDKSSKIPPEHTNHCHPAQWPPTCNSPRPHQSYEPRKLLQRDALNRTGNIFGHW